MKFIEDMEQVLQWYYLILIKSRSNERLFLFQGLTEDRASVILERDGPNDLTPARTTPEIVRLAKNMFGGFAMLLWIGAVLCFIAHGLELYTVEDPQYDNVCYLRINVIDLRFEN